MYQTISFSIQMLNDREIPQVIAKIKKFAPFPVHLDVKHSLDHQTILRVGFWKRNDFQEELLRQVLFAILNSSNRQMLQSIQVDAIEHPDREEMFIEQELSKIESA